MAGQKRTTEKTDSLGSAEARRLLAADRRRDVLRALLACRSEEEIGAFLNDLCTPQELEALSERWLLARLLALGTLSYREIAQATGASTTTIGRVARFLQQEPHQGYSLVLSRLGDGARPEKKKQRGDK